MTCEKIVVNGKKREYDKIARDGNTRREPGMGAAILLKKLDSLGVARSFCSLLPSIGQSGVAVFVDGIKQKGGLEGKRTTESEIRKRTHQGDCGCSRRNENGSSVACGRWARTSSRDSLR